MFFILLQKRWEWVETFIPFVGCPTNFGNVLLKNWICSWKPMRTVWYLPRGCLHIFLIDLLKTIFVFRFRYVFFLSHVSEIVLDFIFFFQFFGNSQKIIALFFFIFQFFFEISDLSFKERSETEERFSHHWRLSHASDSAFQRKFFFISRGRWLDFYWEKKEKFWTNYDRNGGGGLSLFVCEVVAELVENFFQKFFSNQWSWTIFYLIDLNMKKCYFFSWIRISLFWIFC